jgi:hypothetical protein
MAISGAMLSHLPRSTSATIGTEEEGWGTGCRGSLVEKKGICQHTKTNRILRLEERRRAAIDADISLGL